MVSQKRELIKEDIKKWAINLAYFSAPILAVFFALLRDGVSIQDAWPVAALSLYGALADLFKKWASKNTYK